MVLPWLLSSPALTFVSVTYGDANKPFELFGLTGCAALVAVAAWELRRRRGRPFNDLWPVLLLVAVGLYALAVTVEYFPATWDYMCYENAARAIVAHANPYNPHNQFHQGWGTYIIHPPTQTQVMAAVYRGAAAFEAARTGTAADVDAVWRFIFYLFQCAQFYLLLIAYVLCYRLGKALRLPAAGAAILAAALLVLSNPVGRTLRHNQVNLWVLDFILAAILLAARAPFAAGLMAALGGQLKLYPLSLAAPWALEKRWRALAGVVVGWAAVVFIGTNAGRDWALWFKYAAFMSRFPAGTAFRDNSLHSVISNTVDFEGALFGIHADVGTVIVKTAYLVGAAAFAAYFLYRFVRRARLYRAQRDAAPAAGRGAFEQFRMTADAADVLALALIISPLVWEHHYVLAIPLVIWAAATRGRREPWAVGLAAFLMLGVPTFSIYPLSYHRLAGLLWMLYITRPRPETDPPPAALPGLPAAT